MIEYGGFILPRPRRFRRVMFQPDVTYFKPVGIRMASLQESVLTVDEFEAVRLKDLDCIEQEKAAKKMDISQPTFHRLLLSARKKLADAIVHGKAIKIKGGNFQYTGGDFMPGGDGTGPSGRGMGRGFGRGMGVGAGTGVGNSAGTGTGRGRMGGPMAAGPEGNCKCPKCGHEQSHARGQPCNQIKCPKCGSIMTRAN